MSTAIKVENLSKRYRIGLKEELPDTFIGALTSWLKAPVANFRQLHKLSHFSIDGNDASITTNNNSEDIIWALRDISFEVKQGEVVGIIGRNGAGKSTLLKILSRITEPSSGKVIINGRVSSLLEVGTGFHPELTGRENVFLNGTILGMSKKDIDCRFDEIVDFSGIEKFIDTPVKRYSSGMQVRLAFAVAAHLEPEILLVDEVLAVGDAEFQEKCLNKMSEVAKGGRTVLFISHNMLAVQSLCKRTIWLANGVFQKDGLSSIVIETYIDSTNTLSKSNSRSGSIERVAEGAPIEINDVRIFDQNQRTNNTIEMGKDFDVELKYFVPGIIEDPKITLGINHGRLGCLTYASTFIDDIGDLRSISGRGAINCRFINPFFVPGFYHLWVQIDSGGRYNQLISWQHLTSFKVNGGEKYYGENAMVDIVRAGAIYVEHEWQFNN